jgi:FMN phosphatase YigB (HAD superfamily)
MISFIYFDVGGVVELDFSKTNKWAEMKRDMGITPNNIATFDALFNRYKREICISRQVDSLIPIFEKECQIKLPKNYSWLDDFVSRFEKNPSIWPVIEKIHKNCKIGLLTDMYPGMLKAIIAKNLLPPVSWDVIIDSSVVGYKKPDLEIFEIAESEAGVKKDEILFVENQEENIEAATNFGWQTFLYDSANPVESSRRLSELF